MARLIGGLLVLWGVLDVGLSWVGIDVYQRIGITLSEEIYPFTHWIAMGIGYAIYRIGGSSDEAEKV